MECAVWTWPQAVTAVGLGFAFVGAFAVFVWWTRGWKGMPW